MPRRTKRTTHVHLVVTQEEKETFETAAVMCDMTLSDFIRKATRQEIERLTLQTLGRKTP